MPQNIALGVQVPQFDAGAQLQRVGQIQGQASQNAGQEISNKRNTNLLQDETDQSTALRNYRTAAQKGDANAIKQLAGYPELQAKIHSALDSMTPVARNAAGEKVDAWYNALVVVQNTPPAERDAAWKDQIDKLEKGGHLSKEDADFARKTGPTEGMIHDVLTVHAAIGDHKAPTEITPAQTAALYKDAQSAVLGTTHTGAMTPDQQAKVDAAYQHILDLVTKRGYTGPQAVGAVKAGAAGAPAPAPAASGGGDGGLPGMVTGALGAVGNFIGGLGGGGKPAAAPAPTGAPAPAPAGAPAPGGALATAPGNVTVAPTLGGPPARSKPGSTVNTKPAAPAPAPAPKAIGGGSGTQNDPYTLTGDEASMRAAVAAMPAGTYFRNPANPSQIGHK